MEKTMGKTMEEIYYEHDMGMFVNIFEKKTSGKCSGFPDDCKTCVSNQSNIRNPKSPPCNEV